MGRILIGNVRSPLAGNLTTAESGKYALDAQQGMVLDKNKINYSDIVNNQTTTAAGYVLDARQGKAIYTTISDLSNRMEGLNHNLDDVSKRPVTAGEILPNALSIDTGNIYSPLNLKTWSLYTGSGTIQMPPGCTLGVREFYYFNADWYIIKITEFDPMLGRTWYNRYNLNADVWSGWKSVPSV